MPQNGGTDVAVTGCFELYDTQCCTRYPCLAIPYTNLSLCKCETTSVVMRYMSRPHISITQRYTKHKHSNGSLEASKSSWLPLGIDLQYDSLCGRMLPSLWVGVIPDILCVIKERLRILLQCRFRCVWLYSRVSSRYKLVDSDCLYVHLTRAAITHPRQQHRISNQDGSSHYECRALNGETFSPCRVLRTAA